MALLIDTPRWPWRGRLWAHMISDQSLDELHQAAEDLDFRYVSFGRDHYDVPDYRWSEACEVATLVDPRDIVRSLRASGLRVPGGKPRKSWQPVGGLPLAVTTVDIDTWLGDVGDLLRAPSTEVLFRPGEYVALFLLGAGERVDLGALADGPADERTTVRETVADNRYSLELVITDADAD